MCSALWNGARPSRASAARYYPFLVAGFTFLLVYGASLTFVYIEGDDAGSVAFHALGRDRSVQPQYAAYHGMMDVALGILPASEPVVRVTATTLTSLAGIGLVICILALVLDWVGMVSPERGVVAGLAVLVASPEFYYLGLVYTPSVVAMCLVLASHLLVRRVTRQGDLWAATGTAKTRLILSLALVLFGLGVACRWDTVGYGLVIVADLLLGNTLADSRLARLRIARVSFGVAWGILAVAVALAAIALSGSGLAELYERGRETRDLTTSAWAAFSPATVARFQTLFTPAFVVLGGIGYGHLVARRRPLAALVAVGVLPAIAFLYSGIPKMIIAAIPCMVLSVIHGFNVAWFPPVGGRRLLILRGAILGLLLAPWIVGIRVYSADTAWGPGFEIRSPEGGSKPASAKAIVTDRTAADRSISATKVGLTFGGGFAVPTQEGPRPLGGHAAVLLGGEWRDLANKLDRERRRIIDQALLGNRPILQDDRNAFLLTHLVAIGFSTRDPYNRFLEDTVVRRVWKNDRGERLRMYGLRRARALFDERQLEKLASVTQERTFLLYSGYSSTIRALERAAPDAIGVMGPFSAILDIEGLREAIGRSGESLSKPSE